MNENILVLRVLPEPFRFGRVEKDLIQTGSVAGRNADAASFLFRNQRINNCTRVLFGRVSVGHAGKVIGESVSKLESFWFLWIESFEVLKMVDELGWAGSLVVVRA